MPSDLDTTESDSPLWQFAVRLYSTPSVAPVCLSLQDSVGADVNLLLVCCWSGLHGAYLPAEQIEALDRLVQPWRVEAILPVRRLRRQLKVAIGPVQPDMSAGLREQIKAAELEAEKIELSLLYQALETLPAKNATAAERGGVIRGNLLRYLAVLEAETDANSSRDAVETLVRETLVLE